MTPATAGRATATGVGSSTRRSFLRAIGATAVAGAVVSVAGCVATGSTGRLTVGVTNEDEVGHTVALAVTDDAGTVVEQAPAEVLDPGVSRTYTSDGYSGDAYLVAVEGGEDATEWRQVTRWGDLDTCPALTCAVRITRRPDDTLEVLATEECASA